MTRWRVVFVILLSDVKKMESFEIWKLQRERGDQKKHIEGGVTKGGVTV